MWLLSKFCGSFHLFSDSILFYHGQLQICIVVHIKRWYHVISVMAKFRKDIYEMTWCCHLTTHPYVIISLGLYNLMTWWLYRWMDSCITGWRMVVSEIDKHFFLDLHSNRWHERWRRWWLSSSHLAAGLNWYVMGTTSIRYHNEMTAKPFNWEMESRKCWRHLIKMFS